MQRLVITAFLLLIIYTVQMRFINCLFMNNIEDLMTLIMLHNGHVRHCCKKL